MNEVATYAAARLASERVDSAQVVQQAIPRDVVDMIAIDHVTNGPGWGVTPDPSAGDA